MRAHVSDVLWQHSTWMTWNALLALVPLVLAHLLFQRPVQRRTAWWWTGVVAFVLFLPNAPYVLTDVIHLFEDVRRVPSDRAVLFVLVPVYALLFAVGFGAYALSIRIVVHWLWRQNVSRPRTGAVVLGVHAIAALGVDIGRFGRFNSWDVLVRPAALATACARSLEHPLRLVVTFAVIVLVYAAARLFVAGAREWLRTTDLPRPHAA